MNRRNFLKSVGVACGLIVVSPLKLLSEKKPDIQFGIDYWVDLHKNRQGNWVYYHAEYSYTNKELVGLRHKLKQAMENTEFIKSLCI